MTHSNDPNCPLCHGSNYRPNHKLGEYVECDHSYIIYGGKVIATGWMAVIIFNASLIVPAFIIGLAISGIISFVRLML